MRQAIFIAVFGFLVSHSFPFLVSEVWSSKRNLEGSDANSVYSYSQHKLDFSILAVSQIRVYCHFYEKAPLTFTYLNRNQKLTWDEFKGDILKEADISLLSISTDQEVPVIEKQKGSFETLLTYNTRIGNLPNEVSHLIETYFTLFSMPTTQKLRMICGGYALIPITYNNGTAFQLERGKKELELQVYSDLGNIPPARNPICWGVTNSLL